MQLAGTCCCRCLLKVLHGLTSAFGAALPPATQCSGPGPRCCCACPGTPSAGAPTDRELTAPSCMGVAAVVTGISIADVLGPSMAGVDTMADVLGRPVVTGRGPVDINATASDGASPTTLICRSAAHVTIGQGLRRGFGTQQCRCGSLHLQPPLMC